MTGPPPPPPSFISIELDDDDDDEEEGKALKRDWIHDSEQVGEEGPSLLHESILGAKRPKADRNLDRSSKASKKSSPFENSLAGHTRTVYLGGLPPATTVNDLFNQVKGAPIEALRILPEKMCAFIDFFDEAGALVFFDRYLKGGRRFQVRGKDLKVSWAKPSAMSETVQRAIRNGATRNVYLGQIECKPNEVESKRDELVREFEPFGPLDLIKIVPERKIAFVHLASVASAMSAVNALTSHPRWRGKRISFGSDRCGDRPPPGVHPTLASSGRLHESSASLSESADLEDVNAVPGDHENSLPYRTIYIGGVSTGTTFEELCDVIRGGMVQSIRMSTEKHCAFVTFIDQSSAMTFFSFFSHYGFLIRGQPLKLGWGKPSEVPFSVTQALQKGATRNVYIGNIEVKNLGQSPETYLARECSSRFGPVETVNILPLKNVAFVNFCNLLDAVKATAGLPQLAEYSQCKVAYGKDRCAQLPKPPSLPAPYQNLPLSGPPLTSLSYGSQPSQSLSSSSTAHPSYHLYPTCYVPSTSGGHPPSVPLNSLITTPIVQMVPVQYVMPISPISYMPSHPTTAPSAPYRYSPFLAHPISNLQPENNPKGDSVVDGSLFTVTIDPDYSSSSVPSKNGNDNAAARH